MGTRKYCNNRWLDAERRVSRMTRKGFTRAQIASANKWCDAWRRAANAREVLEPEAINPDFLGTQDFGVPAQAARLQRPVTSDTNRLHLLRTDTDNDFFAS